MNKDIIYPVEIKIANKKSWFTPAESNAYYATKYSRNAIAIHWWGDGTGASNHDNIVNYFLNQGNLGKKSVNYVVSDNKITLMVSPDNVAWTTGPGNPTTISIEHQPTLGAEGYKKSGWLVDQLEERYGRRLEIFPHNRFQPTQCPGSISLSRIRAEADKWKTGGYNPAPPVATPKPAPPVVPAPTVSITYSVLPAPVSYTVNKDTNLWNFNTATWAGFLKGKVLKKGEGYTVHAIADNHSVKAQYGVTKYSFDKKLTNGVNMKDLDLVSVPQPIPVPPVVPPVVPVDPDRNAIIAFLTGLMASIGEFLKKFTK